MFSKLITIILVTGFLTACGASGGGQPDPDPISNNPSSRATISSTPASTPASVAASSVMSQASSIANSVASQASSVASQTSSSQVAVSSSSRSSSVTATSSSRMSSVSSSRSSSSRSSISSSRSSSSVAVSSSSRSSSSRSSSSSSIAAQSATIQWSHPTQRENGDFLELNEIGGYEIRVRPANSSNYSYYTIAGNTTTSYLLNNYVSTMTVEIAVYDNQGLYSQFVTVSN